MTNYSTLAYRLKREFLNFSKKICKGMKKPELKLICNMLYGISEAGSCHLSKIGRALNETITLKKTIERLSRGLDDFSDNEKLLDNYTETVKRHIDDRTVFVVDGSDVTKQYSKSLEGLAIVRDGSTGEFKPGYHTLEIAALTKDFKTPIPVYDRVYSAVEDGFVSEDEEALNGLRFLSAKFGNKGIRTLDRGYDAVVYYKYFLKNNEKFIIRAKKNRSVKYKGETRNIMDVAKLFKGKYRLDFKSKNGKKIDAKQRLFLWHCRNILIDSLIL